MRSPIPRATALLIAPLLIGGCEDVQDLFLDTYIIMLAEEPAEVVDTVNSIAVAFDLEPIHIFQQAAQGFQVRIPIGVIENIEGLDEVKYVVIDNPDNYRPPVDYEPPEIPADAIPEGIARIGGPALVDLGDVEVAVIDTGVDLDHPDLNVVGAVDLVAASGGTDLGGDDPHGHGTHVAGTIGALGAGVAGVSPGVPIHAVRVLDEYGSGTLGDIIAGLEYVLDNPSIKVVNMSLGGYGDPSASNAPLRDAIDAVIDAGVVVCIAAGNEASNTNQVIPAGYDRGVIVSAYDAYGGDNGFAYFSNYGNAVDITAPGVTITSTWIDGEYAAISGTSMAAPHVAGAMAAWMAQNPGASPASALSTLVSTAESGLSGATSNHSEPMVDLDSLLQ